MQEEQRKTVWRAVLTDLEQHLSKAQVKTWFSGSTLLTIEGGIAEVGVENQVAKNLITRYAEDRLLQSLSTHLSAPVTKLTLSVTPGSAPREKVTEPSQPAAAPLFATPTDPKPSPAPEPPRRATVSESQPSNLNPRYTFSNFIVGNRNRLAFAAAQGVAERPGALYNPLYLYGGVGLGKTHLMQAVGNAVIAREPEKRVLYVSCDHFISEFVACLQSGKINAFKKKYRSIDVFLIDDIQFIAGKEGTQEEFFHTFNTLYETGKQIIITSDKIPSEIKNLEERLSSRFYAGLIADIQPPDFETRQAILSTKCTEKGLSLSNQILAFIAEQVETNIRELEGALTTVAGHLLANGISEPTETDIRAALHDRITVQRPSRKSKQEQLFAVISEYFQVPLDDIRGPRRHKELVKPRQVLMYLLKHDLGMTFPAIGKEIGGRDHTTVMYAVGKIEKEMKRSPELVSELDSIKGLYYAGGK